ncbi:MAG: hypothetical protein LKG19_14720 [Saprospiraceae bacterium]|jgi:hypothetical protein|nr:hypothetical protein [Saprospiraceae bacterium]
MTSCKQKELDWTQLTSFKIYDFKTFPQDKDLRTCSDSDIQQMKYIETNLDQAKNVLSKSIPLGETSYLWKGHHFTTATFSDGLTRSILVSYYGGFFMDLTTNKYYKFQGDTRTEWENFWRNYYKTLQKYTENACQKCDIEKLKTVNEHLDSLTFKIVFDFVCTFDTSCKNNIEYSEWSNELLFKILDKSPTLLIEVLSAEKGNTELILNEIKSPLLDINLQNLYDKVKGAASVEAIRTEFLNAIITASEKDGQKIKK